MDLVLDKGSGCTACMSTCPKDAITMQLDREGFLYPRIDEERCVNYALFFAIIRAFS